MPILHNDIIFMVFLRYTGYSIVLMKFWLQHAFNWNGETNKWEIHEERTWQMVTDNTSFAPVFPSLNSPLGHYKKSGHLPVHAALNEMWINFIFSTYCQHALNTYMYPSNIGLQCMQKYTYFPFESWLMILCKTPFNTFLDTPTVWLSVIFIMWTPHIYHYWLSNYWSVKTDCAVKYSVDLLIQLPFCCSLLCVLVPSSWQVF